MNFLRGRIGSEGTSVELETGDTMPLPSGRFTFSAGQEVTLGMRPNPLDTQVDGAIKVTVKSVEQLGGEAYVYSTLSNGQSLTLHMPGQIGAKIGEVLTLAPRAEELHLFDTASGDSLRAE